MKKTTKTLILEAMLIMAITLVLAILVGCGPSKYVAAYSSLRDDEQDSRIHELEKRVTAMGNAYAALSAQVQGLAEDETANSVEIAQLQSSANLALAQLATLQQNVHVTAIIDPCGDGPGFDEVILKTSAGYMAYFESGSNRFLALIPAGSYRTTDASACPFTISTNGLCDNLGCH